MKRETPAPVGALVQRQRGDLVSEKVGVRAHLRALGALSEPDSATDGIRRLVMEELTEGLHRGSHTVKLLWH